MKTDEGTTPRANAQGDYYVTGGTLRHDAPSYVERQADKDLLEGLLKGEFCYVLTSRQMGKSSLMVRTANKLREQGVSVLVLDLTAVGQPETKEQWYGGLLTRLGTQARLEDELEDFWWKNKMLGPAQRFFTALHKIILEKAGGPVVIFVDELDVVRSLSFSTDEFFAAIRECYTRRVEESALERLTFCLLGVATPGDLIRDTRLTPFNIGRRIELNDFTPAEAAPLVKGLATPSTFNPQLSSALLERVLCWTAGHPYLTQRLCQALAADGESRSPESVDRMCEALFFAARAREQDDNLLFVRERMLRSEVDLASLLHIYEQVRAHKQVRDDETDPLVSILRLSGVTRAWQGQLQVRNRIYERVFDRAWVRASMPDAELRRQRTAFRKGVARAAAVATLILAALGALAVLALRSANEARRERDKGAGLVYASQMNLAYNAHKEGKIGRALVLLEDQRHGPDGKNSPAFEWRYLWRVCQSGDRFAFPWQSNGVFSVAYSPDGRMLVMGTGNGVIQEWDAVTKQLSTHWPAHTGPVDSLAFHPNGRWLASASGDDGTVKLWDVASRALLCATNGSKGIFVRITFNHDGRILAAGSPDNKSTVLWNVDWTQSQQRPAITWKGKIAVLPPVAFSPDGRILALCGGSPEGIDANIRLYNLASGELIQLPAPGTRGDLLQTVAFSADGKILAGGGAEETIFLWNIETRSFIRQLSGHSGAIWSMAFSRDGQMLASGSWDETIKLWSVASGSELATLQGHTARVLSLEFSPDGETLASASPDGIIKLWETNPEELKLRAEQSHAFATLEPGLGMAFTVEFSPDGRTLAVACNDGLQLWDIRTRSRMGKLKGSLGFHGAAFTSDGKMLAAGSGTGPVLLWDLTTLQPLDPPLLGHTYQSSHVGFGLGGTRLVSGGGDGTIRVWDVASHRELTNFPGVVGLPVQTVALSPDGKTVAAGSADHQLRLWSMESLASAGALEGTVRFFHAGAFSPDGKLFAGADMNGRIFLWDVHTRRRVRTFIGHSGGAVMSMAFSPDGRTLATGSMDHTIKLWNPGIEQEVATLTGHTGWVWSVAFAPDGNLLASVSTDGKVRLWQAASLNEIEAEKQTKLVQQ